MSRPVAGYTITRYWCRKCVPEGITYGGCEVYGDSIQPDGDFGVPYFCDDCGDPMVPCDHAWANDWHNAWVPEGQPPQEIDFCQREFCGEARYRPA